MNDPNHHGWTEANQRHLSAALAVVRGVLTRYASNEPGPSDEEHQALADAEAAMPAPAALQTLAALFGLSPFEQLLLVLCAGVELDGRFASLCARGYADAARPHPTFGLALAALPAPHWSAVSPAGPLRHWRLIDIAPGNALTSSPLRIDERILHYLAGVECPDERLAAIVELVPAPEHLVPSHQALAERIVAAWSIAKGRPPVAQLLGTEPDAQRAVAAAAAAALGLSLGALSAAALPPTPTECDALVRLWERESALTNSALLLDCDGLEPADTARQRAVKRLIEGARGALFVVGRERRREVDRPTLAVDVHRATTAEQQAVWRRALGGSADTLNGRIDALTAQFSLSARAISAAATEAASESTELSTALWEACRTQARPRLNDLAQRLVPAATWDDLVLPDEPRQALREMAAHVRQRSRVYDTWGFAAKGARGLGISALFSGASGTGKTMAAEVLSAELRLDLYRVDLSALVSKYIGETEKNLRRVFDAAEDGGAILLFDEADALFGKRSEVKDSHDRYANIEVSYLLQRMEAYRGLAILTTNLRDALDVAFLRRLRFVVNFPFPDAALRAELWRRAFPKETPTRHLDVARLARLNIAGGNVRNIALYAAVLAAEAGEPVGMAHLARAARTEYAKLERPLTDAEIGGWV
jgi:hypothetical protein